MALKFLNTALTFAALAITTENFAMSDDGVRLFEDNCAACHMGEARGPDRLAPPIFAVKNHYAHLSRQQFVEAVSAWVRSPDEKKSFMPGAVRRFGLMEPLDIDEPSARKIAEFIYSGEFQMPGWYAEHYRQEHGKDPQ